MKANPNKTHQLLHVEAPDSMMVPMNQKEIFCLVRENSSLSVQTKRNRKGRGSSLRESLAWNQAFFTEEGVLDPSELSCLSKSSSKSVGNSLLLNELSPLTSYHKSSVNLTTTSSHKDSKSRKLFQSSNIKSEAQMLQTGGKTLSSKGTFKGIPGSPSTNLHKRVATTVKKLTSKVPKFTKLPSASRTSGNPMLPACSPKIDKSIIEGHARQNATVKSPIAKMDFACSSLFSNLSAADHGKSLDKIRDAGLKEGSIILPSNKHGSVTCSPSKQVAKPLSQAINNIPRPSALRMPSPSLGFFCQGKASTSYNNQPQRPTQESKIPPIMPPPKKSKQKSQPQPQPASFGQQSQLGSSLNEACQNATGHSLIDDYLDCSSDVVLGIANEIGLNVSAENISSSEEEKNENYLWSNEELGRHSVLPNSEACIENHESHSDSINTIFSLSEKPDADSHSNSTCMNSPTDSDLLGRRKMMSSDTSRQDILLNVVPFSDEWVAALEAFGEEILVKKTGAVQNSPTDKSLPEPGPWSPVKKKAQDVGPFDCTKCTKNVASSRTD